MVLVGIYLVLISLFIKNVKGQSFEIKSIQPFTEVGSHHVFYCNLTSGGYPGAAYAVRFVRNNVDICKVAVRGCTQDSAADDRFSCGCLGDNEHFVLNISDIRSEDEDDWFCGLTYYSSLKSSMFTLPLYFGPQESIDLYPPSDKVHTVNEGNSLIPIKCSATCKPECQLSWYKDTTPPTLITNTSVMYLTNTVKLDEGDYYCEASNLVGKNISYASVYVHAKPPPVVQSAPPASNLTFGVGIGIGVVICAVVMVTGMIFGMYCYRKRKNHKSQDLGNISTTERNDLFVYVPTTKDVHVAKA